MFADYRVPQVLVHFGAMSYDEHLMKLLQDGENHKFKSIVKSINKTLKFQNVDR